MDTYHKQVLPAAALRSQELKQCSQTDCISVLGLRLQSKVSDLVLRVFVAVWHGRHWCNACLRAQHPFGQLRLNALCCWAVKADWLTRSVMDRAAMSWLVCSMRSQQLLTLQPWYAAEPE